MIIKQFYPWFVVYIFTAICCKQSVPSVSRRGQHQHKDAVCCSGRLCCKPVSLGKMSPAGMSDQERNCVWLFLKKENDSTKGWNDVIHVWDHPVPFGPLSGLMARTLNMADIRCAGWEIIQTDTVWVFWTHCQLNWRFFIAIIIYFLAFWMAGFLLYQLCHETSSLLSNFAVLALFPHEWAMREGTAFNFCSKFDRSRSQPIVKHNCLKISLSGDMGNPLWPCMTFQKKEGLRGSSSQGFSHVLSLTGRKRLLRLECCSKLGEVPQLVRNIMIIVNVRIKISREAVILQHIYCCFVKLSF